MFFNGVADFGGVAAGDGLEDNIVAGEDEVGNRGYVKGIGDGNNFFGIHGDP